MSLEQAVLENTSAVRELIAILATSGRNVIAPVKGNAQVATTSTQAKPVATNTAQAKPVAVTIKNNPPVPTKVMPVAAPVQDEVVISYEAVSKATLGLVAAKGKPAAIDLFAEYGIPNAKVLTVEQYAGFIDRVNTLMAELPDVVK